MSNGLVNNAVPAGPNPVHVQQTCRQTAAKFMPSSPPVPFVLGTGSGEHGGRNATPFPVSEAKLRVAMRLAKVCCLFGIW
mmetsp:Transcript_76603/g.124505  ORF Transcript_76603/g.124505 Transcript_76603/m.124505 type:complete len:80 (-) Transcript_76603:159-398(-)